MTFVTTTISGWVPVFSKRKYAECLIRQLDETLRHYRVTLAAYVIMPTHIHLLLGFRKIEEMSTVMQSFKRLSSRRLKEILPNELKSQFLVNGSFRFWQTRFDDVIIFSEKQFKIKMDYIHNNPVKAKLSDTAAEFEFSSARDWLSAGQGILQIDKNWKWLD